MKRDRHAGAGRRPRRRALRAAVTALTITAIGATAVVVALNRLDDDTPVAERCVASADGQSWYFSTTQADNAALIGATTLRRGLPARAATIGLATALQESRLENIDYGDRDSVGLFQQRPSQGWGTVDQIMDPVYSTNAFFDALVEVGGYEGMAVTEAAQAVQRSAFPEAYAKHEARSRAWASALTGYSPAALTCELAPVSDTDLATTDPAEFRDRVARDLGDLRTDAQGSVVEVDARPLLPDDATRAGWAAGQWAVAVADSTDVDSVQVADHRWSRESPGWERVDGEPVPAGRVRVEVAAPDAEE